MSAPAVLWGQGWVDADDSTLLALVRDGNAEAYAELWRRHLPAAYGVAHRYRGRTSAEDVVAVIRAGARGYVTKTIDATALVDAIRRVHDGDAVFSPRLAGFVLDAFSGHLPAPTDPELDLLTSREQEVMRLIARGYTYREVASRLHLSVKTVETHVSAVLRKLQLSNRHELTAWAADRRLL